MEEMEKWKKCIFLYNIQSHGKSGNNYNFNDNIKMNISLQKVMVKVVNITSMAIQKFIFLYNIQSHDKSGKNYNNFSGNTKMHFSLQYTKLR